MPRQLSMHYFFMLCIVVSIMIIVALLTVDVSLDGTSGTWRFEKANITEMLEGDGEKGPRINEKGDSNTTENHIKTTRGGELYPPPLTAGDKEMPGMVWSRGSWGRFDADSSPSLSGGNGAICTVYPSVSSLAVSCRGLTGNDNKGSIFPLQFTVEHQEGIDVHDVVCSQGCKRATLGEFTGKGRKNVVIIKSLNDLTEPCATNVVCMLFFDFLVSPTGTNKRISALPPVCFLSIGDWGRVPGVIPIANALNDVANMSFSKFIISTGDNFYPIGVKSLKDPHWVETFEKPFSGPYVKNVRWYISLGNHDHWGFKDAQLQYAKIHPRWYLPFAVYDDLVPLFDSRKTSYLAPNNTTTDETVISFSSIKITTLDTYARKKKFPAQVAFLEESLGHANMLVKDVKESASGFVSSVWKLVLNHAPLFSGSMHGQEHENTVPLRRRLKPIIDKHKAHIYLNGDDHVLEVLHSGSTDYFVNGAGGGAPMYKSKRIPETVWHQENNDKEKSGGAKTRLESKWKKTSAGEGEVKVPIRMNKNRSVLPRAENQERLRGFMRHCVYFGGGDGVDNNVGQRMVTSLIKVDEGTGAVGVLYDHTTLYSSSGSGGKRKMPVK